MKMFEYMSVKLPIISSDLPILREILIHKQNCLLVPPDDITAWSKAINMIIHDKKLEKLISTQAYELFMNKFTWEERCKKMLSL